ncbi:ruBisCO-associated protein-like [Senna tora]|uniref:RuBisCO-associated protein-like n=1 Tax=Senna tora TaxID=362788 RepID=A0A834SMR3_9FABA|nr:ruBisCO-associated protein-like [Senna tora]
MSNAIFRQYTFDDSFLQVYVPTKLLKEYQIALIFATDYDDNGNPTNGIFHIYWDQTKVTPSSIQRFKKSNPDVPLKVFITIGDRHPNHPFHPIDNHSWISNATKSLTAIIQNADYDLSVNGIDVFYQHIDAHPDDFALCIGQLITNLKAAQVISVASISPSASVNKDYYFSLYGMFDKFIEWVDYQFQNEESFVASPDDLKVRFNALVSEFYPIRKLIAGYSAENEDWAKLSPIIFFLAGSDLFNNRNKKKKVSGFSILYHNYGDSSATTSTSPACSSSSASPPT